MKILCLLLIIGFSQTSRAHDMALGLNIFDYDYKEELTAPDKSSEKGIIPSVYGKLKIDVPGLSGKNYVEFDGEIALSASTTYDGTVLSTHAPISATDKNTFLRAEGSFYFSVVEPLWLHAGYGYRYWRRSLVYGSGYNEVYTWTSIPLGILVSGEVISGVKLGLDLTYKIMVGGKIDVIFSETVTGGNDTTLDLGNKPGYKISLPIEIQASDRMKVFLKPWYEYSEIGVSNTAYNSTPTGTNSVLGYIQEPPSKTKQIGLIAALTFEIQ